jgi:hypothetical protein
LAPESINPLTRTDGKKRDTPTPGVLA